MLAICGASEDEPARLIIYKDLALVNDRKVAIQEIWFTNIRHIHTKNLNLL